MTRHDASAPLGALLRDIAAALVRHADSLADAAEVEEAPSGLLTGAQLDRALGISASTRNRLVHEGMPHETVGSRRRYELATCRAWLAARGSRRVATTTANSVAAEDGATVAERLGLKRAAA